MRGELISGRKHMANPGASQVAPVVRNLPTNAGEAWDVGSIPGLGRSPKEGNGNLLQYPCLKNPMDRRAWPWIEEPGGLQSMGPPKSRTRPSNYTTVTTVCSSMEPAFIQSFWPSKNGIVNLGAGSFKARHGTTHDWPWWEHAVCPWWLERHRHPRVRVTRHFP